MKITALLPMKAHSARVPGKNMRDFCGQPLYHAVMRSLLGCRYIGQIVINTDGEEIRRNALEHFGERVVVHDRPENLRGDFVPMNDIIADDLSRLEGEHFLQTHSTNPLLRSESIDRAVERYLKALKEGYNSLFSVTRFQTRLYDKDGNAINHDPEELLRTQDLPPVYEENSCIYIFSRDSFEMKQRRIGAAPLLFEISREEAIDIDEELDFRMAECLYKSAPEEGR